MKMNKYNLRVVLLALAIGLCTAPQPLWAQHARKAQHTNKDRQEQAPQKSRILQVDLRIVDAQDRAIPHAQLVSSQGSLVWDATPEGMISAPLQANEVVVIKAAGYADLTLAVTKNNLPDQLVMYKAPLDAAQRSTRAISSLDGEKLEGYADLVLTNALQGRLAGLTVISGTGGLGNNTPSLYIRGAHRNGGNSAMVVVDGLERDLVDFVPEEIESIEILKDAGAKILYGPRAANGVILVTTKQGKANTRILRTSVESGVKMGTRMPEYLYAYDYARLYNEARANDGMPPLYSEAQLHGYANSQGVNDVLYPNVDFHDYFLRNQSMYRKATFDMKGGSDNLKYALVLNYIGGDGFEKVGQRPGLNRINIRGNVEASVTDYLSIVARAAARLETRKWGSKAADGVFEALSTTRPNDYPLMISSEILGLPENEDGTPFFGANMKSAANLLADMQYGGFNAERYISSMADVGLAFDLNNYIKGLSANAFLMFDNYSYFSQNQSNTYPTYALRGTNLEDLEFYQMRKQSLQSNQSRKGDNLRQRLGMAADITWRNTQGKHDLEASLSYKYYKSETNGMGQNILNDNTALRLHYGYDARFFVEATAALMGSNRFAQGHRFCPSYAVGAAWILSNEGFLSEVQALDFLKLKASYGRLGFDRETDFLLYNTRWQDGGNINFGEQNKGVAGRTTDYIRVGKDLKWETATEWNLGLEARLFQHKLQAEVNWFNELRSDIICSQTAQHFGVTGDFVSLANGGQIRNMGVDVALHWNQKKGDFTYMVGLNALWSQNKLLQWNQVNYPETARWAVGKPTDAIMGYEALGIYGKDVQLGNVQQLLGHYGVGYLAYKDLNQDGLVDQKDQKMIGNTFPRTSLGVEVDLRYKGWGLYLHGTSLLGLSYHQNTSYHQIAGEGKYSILAMDRWHPVHNPEGAQPALTTTAGTNNFVNSTFWLQDGAFFRLKDAELSYTFTFTQAWCKHFKLFARGNNLLVLSAIKDLDPETKNAGVTQYPYYTTLTGGLTLTF